MWLIAEYESAALFSLRPGFATASGGKTLLVPTPYAIKMALLDALCRTQGAKFAEERWPRIASLQVAIRLGERAVVTNLFQKMLKPRRSDAGEDDQDAGYFQRTIGYREYAHVTGVWALGVGWKGNAPEDWLSDAAINISYIGKRGSFVQLVGMPLHSANLPEEFVEMTTLQSNFPLEGTMQKLDDCSESVSFDKVNVYSGTKMTLGKDRISRAIVLPYRVVRSSRSFTLYERLDWFI